MVCSLSGIVNRPLALSMDYCKKIPSYMYIIIYTYYALKIVLPFYNGLLIETCLYITNDLLYLNLFFVYKNCCVTHMSVIRFTIFLSLNIFGILLFLYNYNILYYIYTSYFYLLWCMFCDIFSFTCLSTEKNNIKFAYM